MRSNAPPQTSPPSSSSSSSTGQPSSKSAAPESATATARAGAPAKPGKTQAELDEEVRHKLEDIAGEGGEAGVEYEDGRPVAMKRAVRENMFRYI